MKKHIMGQPEADIAVIANDIKWIKKTLGDISTQLKGIPIALENLSRRVDGVESRLNNHIEDAEGVMEEHRANVLFRQDTQALLRFFKYVVPLIGVSNIALIMQFFFG